MRFCPLLHGFLSKSHDLKCYIKPRRYSLFYKSIKTQDYVISPHQVHLSKTTKHWDGFVSHCTCCCPFILIETGSVGYRDVRRDVGVSRSVNVGDRSCDMGQRHGVNIGGSVQVAVVNVVNVAIRECHRGELRM